MGDFIMTYLKKLNEIFGEDKKEIPDIFSL